MILSRDENLSEYRSGYVHISLQSLFWCMYFYQSSSLFLSVPWLGGSQLYREQTLLPSHPHILHSPQRSSFQVTIFFQVFFFLSVSVFPHLFLSIRQVLVRTTSLFPVTSSFLFPAGCPWRPCTSLYLFFFVSFFSSFSLLRLLSLLLVQSNILNFLAHPFRNFYLLFFVKVLVINV